MEDRFTLRGLHAPNLYYDDFGYYKIRHYNHIWRQNELTIYSATIVCSAALRMLSLTALFRLELTFFASKPILKLSYRLSTASSIPIPGRGKSYSSCENIPCLKFSMEWRIESESAAHALSAIPNQFLLGFC